MSRFLFLRLNYSGYPNQYVCLTFHTPLHSDITHSAYEDKWSEGFAGASTVAFVCTVAGTSRLMSIMDEDLAMVVSAEAKHH